MKCGMLYLLLKVKERFCGTSVRRKDAWLEYISLAKNITERTEQLNRLYFINRAEQIQHARVFFFASETLA